MGLSLKFVTGPAREILEALEACDFDEVERLTEKEADFSFHLEPRDLQTLSECAAPYTSLPIGTFRDALVCYLDEADCGFFIVGDSWVDAMATVGIDNARELAVKWFEKLAENYPDEQIGAPPAEAEQAVRDLIELCRYAVKHTKPVMHIWTA